MKNEARTNHEPKTWESAYIEKRSNGWARIDRIRFIHDFMVCHYEQPTDRFNAHGEPYNHKAVLDYFNKILKGQQPCTEEAKKFAEDYFQITRYNGTF